MMSPGSLRIVAIHPISFEREVFKYGPGPLEEQSFYRRIEEMAEDGFTVWLYEMTDKGWTEF